VKATTRTRIRLGVKESAPELNRLMRAEADNLKRARLHSLYLLKTRQGVNATQIGKTLGFSRQAINRWIELYKKGGLQALLAVEKRGTRKQSVLAGEPMAAIEAQLNQPEGFISYKEALKMVEEKFGVSMKYKTFHQHLRRRTQARLKVGRPRNPKQDPTAREAFEKKLR